MDINYEDYLKQVADLGGVNSTSNSFLEIFLRTEYGEGCTYEGDLQNNLPNGNGVLYYPDKQLYAIGEFEKGRLQGFNKTYDLNGNLWKEGDFLNGIIKKGRIYSGNHKIYFEGHFENNKLTGWGKFINETTVFGYRAEGHYLNGELNGKGKKSFYENIEEGNFEEGDFKNNRLVKGIKFRNSEALYGTKETWLGGGFYGIKKTWIDGEFYEDGSSIGKKFCKINQGKTFLSEEGKFGEFDYLIKGKIFDREGNIEFEGELVNGNYKFGKKYSGKIVEFEGEFISFENRINIRKEGKEFDSKTGKLLKEGVFHTNYDGLGNLKSGIIYSYYNGKISMEGEFAVDGLHHVLHGKGKLYDENGNLFREGNFINGEFQGEY